MTPVAPARLAAWAGSLVRTRSRGEGRVGEAAYHRITRAALLGVASVMAAIAVLWQLAIAARFEHGPFSDWQHYAMAWNRVISGGELYAAFQTTGPFTFPGVLFVGWAYPPASVVFWAPFAAWPVGYVLWTTVNVGLLLTALWAVCTRTWPERRVEAFGVMLLVLSQYRPFVEAAQLGNPDLALAGLLMWAWILGPRAAVVAGILGGAAKVAPVGMLLFARRYGWRWTLYGVGGLAILGLVTLPLVGLDSYFDYARSLSLAYAPCAPVRPDNVAIACQIANGKVIGQLLGISMALGAALAPSRFVAFALATLAYPVANHDLRGHTWMPVVPVAVAYLTTLRSPRSSTRTG